MSTRKRSAMSDSPSGKSAFTPQPSAADEPADHLWRLWQQDQQPELDAVLAQLGPITAAQLAAVLRVDQQQRWQRGERVPAEAYLQQYAELRADREGVLDLIFNEFLLRERLGDDPAPE